MQSVVSIILSLVHDCTFGVNQCCYQDQTFWDQDQDHSFQDQDQKVQDQDHSFQDQDRKVQDQDLASSNKVNATTER